MWVVVLGLLLFFFLGGGGGGWDRGGRGEGLFFVDGGGKKEGVWRRAGEGMEGSRAQSSFLPYDTSSTAAPTDYFQLHWAISIPHFNKYISKSKTTITTNNIYII